MLLLRGQLFPSLLPAPPEGYILKRLRELASTSIFSVDGFSWTNLIEFLDNADGTCMADFKWNSGGEWKGKPWSVELPTDSSLVLYLFCAFISAPYWKFSSEDEGKIEGMGEALYLGRLPPRVKGQFTAILAARLEKNAKVSAIYHGD